MATRQFTELLAVAEALRPGYRATVRTPPPPSRGDISAMLRRLGLPAKTAPKLITDIYSNVHGAPGFELAPGYSLLSFAEVEEQTAQLRGALASDSFEHPERSVAFLIDGCGDYVFVARDPSTQLEPIFRYFKGSGAASAVSLLFRDRADFIACLVRCHELGAFSLEDDEISLDDDIWLCVRKDAMADADS